MLNGHVFEQEPNLTSYTSSLAIDIIAIFSVNELQARVDTY